MPSVEPSSTTISSMSMPISAARTSSIACLDGGDLVVHGHEYGEHGRSRIRIDYARLRRRPTATAAISACEREQADDPPHAEGGRLVAELDPVAPGGEGGAAQQVVDAVEVGRLSVHAHLPARDSAGRSAPARPDAACVASTTTRSGSYSTIFALPAAPPLWPSRSPGNGAGVTTVSRPSKPGSSTAWSWASSSGTTCWRVDDSGARQRARVGVHAQVALVVAKRQRRLPRPAGRPGPGRCRSRSAGGTPAAPPR